MSRFGTSKLTCKRLNLEPRMKNENKIKLLKSYKCQCDFIKTPMDTCNSNSSNNINNNNHQSRIKGDCLLVHVGMAVRGNKLFHFKIT